MTIENPEVVDAIGLERDSGVVVLTICDHLEWHSAKEHLHALQDKINRYLGFVENGELLDSYPLAADKPIRIDVVCKFQPTERATQFLEAARRVAEEYDLSFDWRVSNGISACHNIGQVQKQDEPDDARESPS